jgi:hypothetical protein
MIYVDDNDDDSIRPEGILPEMEPRCMAPVGSFRQLLQRSLGDPCGKEQPPKKIEKILGLEHIGE